MPEIRRVSEELGIRTIVFSTCNTIVGEEDIDNLLMADFVCSSASNLIRERIGPKAVLQLGVSIPVFVLTERGKVLAMEYLKEVKVPLLVRRVRPPYLEAKGPTQPRGDPG